MSISHAKVDEISEPIVNLIMARFKEELPQGLSGIDACKILASINLNICMNIIETVAKENTYYMTELHRLMDAIKHLAIESYLCYIEQPLNDEEIGEEKNEEN